MIVIDSSALLAIILDEPEKPAFEDVITGGQRCVISAVNAHESAAVIRLRKGSDCAAYALAKCTGAPLLFKGSDFKETDMWQCL